MDPEGRKIFPRYCGWGGKILDYIYFEVRGPEADPNVLSDGEGTFRN
jgi:hypothetical protein